MNRQRFGAQSSGGLRYRDFDPGDGYVYRQWANGDITILKSPRGGAGTLLTKTTYPDAWKAITAQINAIKAGKVTKTVADAAAIALAILGPAPQPAPKRRAPPPPPPPMDDPEPLPWGWIAAGVAVVGLGLVAVSERS